MNKDTEIQDDSGDKKYFTIIPNYILNHSTMYDREVYIQMKRITGESGTCWTSQKTLAKQCGISINRLKKSLKYLVDHKWIRKTGTKEVVTKGGIQEVHVYIVEDLWKLNADFFENKKGVSHNDTPTTKGVSRNDQRGITDESKGVSPGDDKEEQVKEEPIKNKATEVAGKEISEIIFLFKDINPCYEEWYGNKTQRGAIKWLIDKFGFEEVSNMVSALPAINAKEFVTKSTTPWELKKNLGKLKAHFNQSKAKPNKLTIAI